MRERERLTVPEVPVLMVFTKVDALGTQAFVQLMGQGVALKQAREGTAAMAQKILATHFQEPYKTTKSPPKDYVRLDGAQLSGSVSAVIYVSIFRSAQRRCRLHRARPEDCQSPRRRRRSNVVRIFTAAQFRRLHTACGYCVRRTSTTII